MVVATSMAWFSGVSKGNLGRLDKSSSPALGILAFETAKTMSRLIAVYKSLSDDEFFKLRKDAMKSQGVAFLNSTNESLLLSLACEEKLQDLNHAACTVSRLGQKCSDVGIIDRFHIVFSDMRLGNIDLSMQEFNSKNADKIIEKMEKYVTATSNLHSALQILTGLEISEQKLQQWKRLPNSKHHNKTNLEYFQERISHQRKQVKHYRENSLWTQTFDKSVGLMARIICITYAQICSLFGPFVPNLPRLSKRVRSPANHKIQFIRGQVYPETDYCLLDDRDKYYIKQQRASKSGPILKTSKNTSKTQFYSHQFFPQEITVNNHHNNSNKQAQMLQLISESTVGAAGLTQRYANIIILAEQYLHAPTCINDDAREVLYEMLPASLKATVRRKLMSKKKEFDVGESDGQSLAEGWRDALEEMMTWLAPIAHDTVKWAMERNMEKQRFDAKPTVLLLQTLYYSDLEKTEAAIVEVLVGLSCIYRYENRRRRRDRCR